MSPSDSTKQGMKCFNCGKDSLNIHLCKSAGLSQIICDDCCKKLLDNSNCQYKACGHYRMT